MPLRQSSEGGTCRNIAAGGAASCGNLSELRCAGQTWDRGAGLAVAIRIPEGLVRVLLRRSCRNPPQGVYGSGLGLKNGAVRRVGLQQFVMRAGGDDAAVFHDYDSVCMPDCIDLLADDDGGSAA